MNAPAEWRNLGRTGAFTTDQVARLVGASSADVASWMKGKTPLIKPDYSTIAGRLILSFDALIEARAVAYLLAEGMARVKVRELQGELRHKLALAHPLARDLPLITDGARAFDASDGRLLNLLNDCYADTELMKPALHGRVHFEGGRAAWLQPAPLELPLLRIDPQRAFGRPIVVDGEIAVPTSTLAQAAESDSPEEAARWFGVSAEAVREAITFEASFNA